jgi:hypothetical protein
LKAIGDAVEKAGLKFLMWFEPERVASGTFIAQEHPEWVIGGSGGGLFNLGIPQPRRGPRVGRTPHAHRNRDPQKRQRPKDQCPAQPFWCGPQHLRTDAEDRVHEIPGPEQGRRVDPDRDGFHAVFQQHQREPADRVSRSAHTLGNTEPQPRDGLPLRHHRSLPET